MSDRLFDPAKADKLEDPERVRWLPPAEVLAAIAPAGGAVIADVGAGTGYFALPLARAVGPAGRVVAVDLQPVMLERLAAKLTGGEAPGNVAPLVGRAAALPLADRSCDALLLANLWHEFDDPAAVAREARRVVWPGGRLVVLDWRPDVDRPPGPPIDHRIAPDACRAILDGAGWTTRPTRGIGPFSWLVIAE